MDRTCVTPDLMGLGAVSEADGHQQSQTEARVAVGIPARRVERWAGARREAEVSQLGTGRPAWPEGVGRAQVRPHRGAKCRHGRLGRGPQALAAGS